MSKDTEQYRIEKAPRSGRPRSRAHDAAILDAALRVMERDGYARMSIEAVAAEAGTTRATVYRRYESKAELATAALSDLRERRPLQRTEDPRADLIEELRRLRRGLERPHGMAMLGTVLAEEHHVPELARAFRRDLVLPRRRRLVASLERLDLRAGLDPETAASLLVGAYYAEYLARGKPRRGWERRVVDAVLGPRDPSEGAETGGGRPAGCGS